MLPPIKILRTGLLAATCMLLSGCIYDDSDCPVNSEDNTGPGVMLEFTMLTRNAASGNPSRALQPPSGTQEIGNPTENYLDLDNLTFLLFDNNQKLLRTFVPDVEEEPAYSDTYIKYRVRTFLHDNYFLKTTETSLTFTIVVLGNYGTLDPQRFNYHIGQDLADIFNQSQVGNFAAPASNNWLNTWIPSIFGTEYTDAFGNSVGGMTAAHIPMAGMQTFTVSTADLRASNPDNPLLISPDGSAKDINMLRALAKIEIIDRIGYTEGVGYEPMRSSIEKAELIGHTTRGSILPTFNMWNRYGALETQYVTATSVPNSAAYIGVTPSAGLSTDDNSSALNFFADREATQLREDGCRVFSCYTTEYNPADRGTTPAMWMRLTVTSPNSGEGVPADSRLYRLEVAPYTNDRPGAVLPLMRNNIYRYVITGISSVADLHLTVQDWDLKETNWNYTDNPGIAEGGYLKWYNAAGTEIFADNQAQLVISYNNPVTGRFTFDEPKDAVWHASFANVGETETDAFKFIIGTNGDGTPILADEATGTIDGRQASIRIVANKAATTFDRNARLIFTVTTIDGRTLSADLTGDEYGTRQYFTIIQNASL